MKEADGNPNLKNKQHIVRTVQFVQETLKGAESGHDWWHILRVWNNAKLLLETEQADSFTVELAALLHDIADSKFNDGNEEIGPNKAAEFLQSIGVAPDVISEVSKIIKNMSFKVSLGESIYDSPEMQVVQDADRLDAIGAIGIARAFTYGGFKNRELYNPDIPPQLQMSKEEYKNSSSPTINHFYEKLLLLKDKMNTEAGRKIAEGREHYIELYLQQFYGEWNGER